MRLPQAAGKPRRLKPLIGREARRLALALLVSSLLHGLLLSLSFGDQAFGLPGLALPWSDRRAEAPELRAVLVAPVVRPAAPAPAPSPAPLAEPARAVPGELSVLPEAPEGLSPPAAAAEAGQATVAAPDGTAESAPEAALAHEPADTQSPLLALGFDEAPAPIVPGLPTLATERQDLARFFVPPVPPLPRIAVAAAPSASSPQPLALEVARQEAAQLESERQAAALLAQAQRRAAQEAARLEALRLQAAKEADERQALLRQAAAEREQAQAALREAARLAEANREAERLRAEAERRDAARQAAAREEAARLRLAQDDEQRREAALRAIGRQLDEEAAQRDAAARAAELPRALPPASSGARRGRLFGRADANAELVLYAEAWARKIQLNTAVAKLSEAVRRPHTDPVVTVAIRRDGSVESVSFVTSSGVAEVDEAVRRIVQGLLPYPAFSAELAREFDVIEIRRTWTFDSAVRLY